MIENEVNDHSLTSFFLLGEPGGCGICPAAVQGLQGDRGSVGYRGRPGVSIPSSIVSLLLSNFLFIL